MALSHQWFLQWSPPSTLVSDFNRNTPTEYSWNDFLRDSKSFEDHSKSFSDNFVSGPYFETNVFDPEHGFKTTSAFRKVKSRKRINAKEYDAPTSLTGATLWLTMLGLTTTQSIPADIETPPFKTLYKWKFIDFDFLSPIHRQNAIRTGKYKQENVLPLGVEIWRDRIWVTIPRWRSTGVPATLATVSRFEGVSSPLLKPYPNWNFHGGFGQRNTYNCSILTSVFRINADSCGRLWVLDSGQIDSISEKPKQICPPSIFVFDLYTDTLLARYTLPNKYVMQNSLFSNIIVDSRKDDCSDLHLYISDTWRFGLLVFRESDASFWRFSSPLFFPDPLASNFTLQGLNFQWTDGILGLALSPINQLDDRVLYFHSLSSYREFFVHTSVLRNPLKVKSHASDFLLLGESRGLNGQSSTSAIDRRGVMFYGLVTRDSVGCWDSNKPYVKYTTGVVARDSGTLIFPNDIKVDSEVEQNVWVLSNRLPMFQARPLSTKEYNYRILHADTKEAVRSTVCDPTNFVPLIPFKKRSLLN